MRSMRSGGSKSWFPRKVVASALVAREDFAPFVGIETQRFQDGRAVFAGARRWLVDVRRVLAELEAGVHDLDLLPVRKTGHLQRNPDAAFVQAAQIHGFA